MAEPKSKGFKVEKKNRNYIKEFKEFREDIKFPSQEEMGMSNSAYERFMFEQGIYRDPDGYLQQLNDEQLKDFRIREGIDEPEDWDALEKNKEKYGMELAQKKAKRNASKKYASRFTILDIADNLGLGFTLFDNKKKEKENV